jgi:integrase
MLTNKEILAARPRERPYKVADGEGLFLIVNPDGRRWWRFRYYYEGRERSLSFGGYPLITLQEARIKRNDARKSIYNGIDPGAQRRAARAGLDNTFEVIAREWLALQKPKFAEKTYEKTDEKTVWTFETLTFPFIGKRPIDRIAPLDVLKLLRRIESRGAHHTAHRTKQRIGQVMRFAVATGRASRDVTADLRGALAPVRAKHHAAIVEPAQIAQLLRAIDSFEGQLTTGYALKLAPLLFVRPGELRHAEWSEFDLDGPEPLWRIPAEKMKMREAHLVPLASQAVALLKEVREISGRWQYVFPSLRTRLRPMSENTINGALRRLGYSREEMTGHGFRTLASTSLNEQGWNSDLIELQLAHAERDPVRAAYNRALRLTERRKMMQAWADHLVRLKEGAVSSWVRAHPATVAPAGSNRSSRGGNEAAEASGVEGHVSDLASTQAVT